MRIGASVPLFLRVTYKVIYDALYHFIEDDGWAMASHVALSSLLAMFPFLIFGTALASFLGANEFSDTAVASDFRYLAGSDRRADFQRGDAGADHSAWRAC